jgi:heme oxygenase (mycobilin-producing)
MLIRIVRMHFKEEGIQEFLTIFNANKMAIRSFPGCAHLELLKDKAHPLTYTTLSHWNNEADLNAYRESEIFGKVWTAVKKQFARQPEAFSLEEFIRVPGERRSQEL